jgi:PiT family inorganic phosphate transporter
MDSILLMIIAIIVALIFDVMNGFHDTANAVATVIYTKALPPQIAIGMSALMNIIGPFLLGTAVAKVIATSIIPSQYLTIGIVIGALMGAIAWDLVTWYYGLPVSSTHALIGGLVGSGLAAIGLSGIKWEGLMEIIFGLLISPVVGVILGLIFMYLIGRFIFSRVDRKTANSWFKKIQVLSSAAVSLAHGSNDAQKTMGIVAMFVAVTYGTGTPVIQPWIIIMCATAIGLGTALGGWRIIRTLGERIGKDELSPSQGFAAETSTALTIAAGSYLGLPISTTHVISSSIVGTVMVGGRGVLNKSVVLNILMAWALTIPVAAIAAAISYHLLVLVGI